MYPVAQPFSKPQRIFEQHGGTLRTSAALDAGITRRDLYTMRDEGLVTELSRGVYRLTTMPPLNDPDLVAVAQRVPDAVVCLISALAMHGLTTQIPHSVDIARPRGKPTPKLAYPPINVHKFSNQSFTSGIETKIVDGQPVRVFNAEKSVADAFKYRNKIGLDVALESLKTWLGRRGASVEKLLEQARICRVERVMRPYLEALL
jgi:predicted transcriptional regulator of viral defense system